MDFYRLEGDPIAENWVPIDISEPLPGCFSRLSRKNSSRDRSGRL
jgi:hypothetical protein